LDRETRQLLEAVQVLERVGEGGIAPCGVARIPPRADVPASRRVT
jgi:hypothetical protein